MIPKERFLCAVGWQETDRVPIQYYATPEVHDVLSIHFAGRDVRECLGVDTRHVAAPYTGTTRQPRDGLTFDMWGTGYRSVSNGSGGTYSEATYLPLAELATMDDVRSYAWPTADSFDYSQVAAACERHRDYAVCVCGAGTPDIVNGVGRGRGMERVLLDIVMRDEVGMAIVDKRVDFEYEYARRMLEAGEGKVDVLCLGEDCGTQHGRLVSPRDFEEVFRPRLQKFIDLAHHYGALAMLHSCGDTHELMPTFIEMGVDILDAMQPEPPGMDPETVRGICGKDLAFCGLISTQKTLPHGTPEECRTEARHRIDVIGRHGGYIFGPAHCIQPGTPLENVLAVYEEALGRTLWG
jgi:uroporphyrinogen decarboxylase